GPETGRKGRKEMKSVINGKRYNTETATLIASSRGDDGGAYSSGRSAELYRTAKGAYFLAVETQWVGEDDGISALDTEEAVERFDNLRDKAMDFEEAFPGVEVEDA
ncbi:MAG: hypothetical protein KAJ12_08670, partial [Bacteroidetes bacterium]|nr:hypothetical protein [Bacteroidota bacterium]